MTSASSLAGGAGTRSSHSSSTHASGFVERNMELGPDARFYGLTPEEEARVEELMSEPDPQEMGADWELQLVGAGQGFGLDAEVESRLSTIDSELQSFHPHQLTTVSSLASPPGRGRAAVGQSPTTQGGDHGSMHSQEAQQQQQLEEEDWSTGADESTLQPPGHMGRVDMKKKREVDFLREERERRERDLQLRDIHSRLRALYEGEAQECSGLCPRASEAQISALLQEARRQAQQQDTETALLTE